ncbi:MAG: hypothetical protein AAF597_06080 [Bacteroidota bacterium]
MRFNLLASLIILCLLVACGKDSAVSGDASVPGSWKLKRALRNNMKTETLNGLFFEFREDGSVTTNLMSEEATTGTYTWEDDQIVTKDVSLPLEYTITELTDSTLNLQSKYRGYQFNFELVRNE